MRLGGPTFEKYNGPDEWVGVLKKLGYRAAYCPVNARTPDDVVKAASARAFDPATGPPQVSPILGRADRAFIAGLVSVGVGLLVLT